MSLNFVEYQGAPYKVLEQGVHKLSLDQFEVIFAYNDVRKSQFSGLIRALKNLKDAGCKRVFVDGSYVTKKITPGDFDVCVDYNNVDFTKLDSVFSNFENKRAAQKSKFLGEFFPHISKADASGTIFLEFFQKEKYTNKPKGIIEICLDTDGRLL